MDERQQFGTNAVETKTNNLESLLAQFISSTNQMILRMEADTRRFAEKVRSDTEKMKNEKKDSKDKKKDSKNKKKDFKDEIRRYTNEMYIQWAERSNKIGTFVEDIVAPNIRSIARDYFHDDDFQTFAHYLLQRSVKDRTVRREFDVIAETDETFYINETRSKSRPEDVKAFRDLLEVVPDFFPDSRGKRLIPIYSALYIPENIQTNLTRCGIYALGMKEGTMDLLNFREVAGPEAPPSDSTG